MKTNELSGAALDWAVAEASGTPIYRSGKTLTRMDMDGNAYWEPSTNWAQSGPIIEREKLGVWWATHFVDEDGVEYGNHWYCETGCTDDNANDSYHIATGTTPLIAAMRCYVASKLGDEVELPEGVK
jgi:hypothetical protein